MTTLNYNVGANVAALSMTRNERLMDTTMARLSTGMRLNSGADDPGAMSVHAALKADGVEARAAVKNVNEGLAFLAIQDSAATKIEGLLVRMKELATQANTSTATLDHRVALDQEYNQLGKEWWRIVTDTQYNGTAIMSTQQTLAVAVGSGTSASMILKEWSPDHFHATNRSAATAATTTSAVNSGGTAFATRANWNQAGGPPVVSPNDAIQTQAEAAAAITKLDLAIRGVGNSRAELGGFMNALATIGENLSSEAVAYEAGASKIGSANYAEETAKLATAQIVAQAATAILSQANAQKATVLGLLK
jgi:flagellin